MHGLSILVLDLHKIIGNYWQNKTGKSVSLLIKILLIFSILLLLQSIQTRLPDTIITTKTIYAFVFFLAALKNLLYPKSPHNNIKIFIFMDSIIWIFSCFISFLSIISGILSDICLYAGMNLLFSSSLISYIDYDPPPKKKTVSEKIKELLSKLKPAPKPVINPN